MTYAKVIVQDKQSKQRDTHIENKLMVAIGELWGEGQISEITIKS